MDDFHDRGINIPLAHAGSHEFEHRHAGVLADLGAMTDQALFLRALDQHELAEFQRDVDELGKERAIQHSPPRPEGDNAFHFSGRFTVQANDADTRPIQPSLVEHASDRPPDRADAQTLDPEIGGSHILGKASRATVMRPGDVCWVVPEWQYDNALDGFVRQIAFEALLAAKSEHD